jgi:flagellar motor switch/type III secretory pathway protein FliN
VESVDAEVAADETEKTEEVLVTDETTEDEITELGIDDVETAEIEPEADASVIETAEIEPETDDSEAETAEIEPETAEVETKADFVETETEDISALETTADTHGEFEELSEEKVKIETEDQEIEVQETPAIDIVESEMPIESEAAETIAAPLGPEMLLNFNHEVVVEIARTKLTGEEITQITYGSIIELDKVAGEPVNLVLDGKTIALGEVVQINNEKLGIRIVGVIQD